MSPSVFSGEGTAQTGLSFPRPAFLRSRYKRLQRSQVSRQSSSQQADPTYESSVPVLATHGTSDPSLQAVQALNRPEPTVVHAAVRSSRPGPFTDGANVSCLQPIHQEHGLLPSPEHNRASFRSRVERLVQAIRRGRSIRFASPDADGRVRFSAVDVNVPSVSGSSEHSVTRQIAEYPENFGRVLGPGSHCIPSPSSVDRRGDLQQPNEATAPARRARSPLITEDQRRGLEQRILAKIAESDNKDRKDPAATVIRREHPRVVDPRVVRTAGISGVQRHHISPIPLDYGKTCASHTPSIASSNPRSDFSSLSSYVPQPRPTTARHPGNSNHGSITQGDTVATDRSFERNASGDESSLEYFSGSSQTEEDGQQKRGKIVSWLRRVSSALKPSESSPARKLGRAIGVFQDKPSEGTIEQIRTPSRRPQAALQDVTNVRRPGYLEKHSFAKEKRLRGLFSLENIKRGKQRQELSPDRPTTRSRIRAESPHDDRLGRSAKRARIAESQAPLEDHAVAGSARATQSSESPASTVRPARGEDDVHPDHAFALARLEGRVPPPPSSPIQRYADDNEIYYGSHVELEMNVLELHRPQPLRSFRYGQWTEALQRAVDDGFDCAIEAPEQDDEF